MSALLPVVPQTRRATGKRSPGASKGSSPKLLPSRDAVPESPQPPLQSTTVDDDVPTPLAPASPGVMNVSEVPQTVAETQLEETQSENTQDPAAANHTGEHDHATESETTAVAVTVVTAAAEKEKEEGLATMLEGLETAKVMDEIDEGAGSPSLSQPSQDIMAPISPEMADPSSVPNAINSEYHAGSSNRVSDVATPPRKENIVADDAAIASCLHPASPASTLNKVTKAGSKRKAESQKAKVPPIGSKKQSPTAVKAKPVTALKSATEAGASTVENGGSAKHKPAKKNAGNKQSFAQMQTAAATWGEAGSSGKQVAAKVSAAQGKLPGEDAAGEAKLGDTQVDARAKTTALKIAGRKRPISQEEDATVSLPVTSAAKGKKKLKPAPPKRPRTRVCILSPGLL